MRQKVPTELERGRYRDGSIASNESDGFNGAFMILGPHGLPLKIVSSTADAAAVTQGWDHVSVSTQYRTPTWEEMCYVKSLFWEDETIVIQLHPPRSQWINNHPHCLHLWRDTRGLQRLPPPELIGIKDLNVQDGE
jgi:hypothetical protein